MKKVLLDTSFLIALKDSSDKRNDSAEKWAEKFLENGMEMLVSSIAISEYAVKENPQEILDCFKIIEFDYYDASKTGVMFNSVKRNTEKRDCFKDDCKMLAQCNERKIDAFITSDSTRVKKEDKKHSFSIIDYTKEDPSHYGLGTSF